MKKVVSLLLSFVLLFAVAACSQTPAPTAAPQPAAEAPAPEAPAPEAPAPEAPAPEAPAPEAPAGDVNPNLVSSADSALDHSDLYTFEWYSNYDWDTIDPWAEDDISKYWGEKFNIFVERTKPDANPSEALNLRIAGNDLPDSMWMDRGAENIRMVEMGLLVDLDTLKPMMGNNWYDDNVTQATQEMLKVNGTLVGVPNWSRKSASGGNNAWMVTSNIYEAAGAPELRTFEDLYDYAIAVRDNVTETVDGLPVIPVLWDGIDANATQLPRAIYRSYGGPYIASGTFYVPMAAENKLEFIFRDPVYVDALLETNKWYRDGLIPENTFTDSSEQFREKLSQGRGGLIWYDHSQDDSNNFRKIVRETNPGNSIELVTAEENGTQYLWLPANGLPYDRIYGEHYGTLGWNVAVITTTAEKPERIFELFSWMLTKQGSVEMMYGPPGGAAYNELDSNGNPILLRNPDSDMTAEERERGGYWKWQKLGHSDNVDTTKFAVNDSLPEASRSWVISAQAHIFTPLMMPLTNEVEQLADQILPDTPLAIQRTICEDYIRAQMPLICMASSEAECQTLIDELIAYCDTNGIQDIVDVYNQKWLDNCATQGGSIYTR
jgi:ABC-type glycerol-3-phosphate transport system substrate-binding protein